MGGVSCAVYLKYCLSIVTSVGFTLYLLLNAPNISACLNAILFAAVIYSILEIAAVHSGGSNEIIQLDKHHVWKIRGIVWCIFQLVCCLLAIHGVIILFGAPVLNAVTETFCLSVLLTALCCGRAFISLGPNALNSLLTARRVGGDSEGELRAVLVLLGAWIGALPIPLDWDQPWQTWPITCTVGALFGEGVACLVLLRQCGAKRPLLY